MKQRVLEVEQQLLRALEPARQRANDVIARETARWRGPARLVEAMTYAVMGDGKRVRPAIAIELAAFLGGESAAARVESAACALEWLHTYSLVHDDLPAMDDDALRRGRPTVHIAFDESTAILAGDALQSEAFVLVAAADASNRSAEVRVQQCESLAKHVGIAGMCGGQATDIGHHAQTTEALRAMHGDKTGALFATACEIAAIAAECDDDERRAWARFGELFGLAYQLSDDILDLDEVADSAHEADVNLAHRLGPDAALAMVRADRAEAAALLDRFAVPDDHVLRLLIDWNEARAVSALA